jgi:hypothetical protein
MIVPIRQPAEKFEPHAPIVVERIAQLEQLAVRVRAVGAGPQLEAERFLRLGIEQDDYPPSSSSSRGPKPVSSRARAAT